MGKFLNFCVSSCKQYGRVFLVENVIQSKTGCARLATRGYRVSAKSHVPLQSICGRYASKNGIFLQSSLSTRWLGHSSVLSALQGQHTPKSSKENESSIGNIKVTGTPPQTENVSKSGAPAQDIDVTPDSELTIFQRFKSAYKEYGKALIGVHVVTSVFWFGGFYYAAMTGVDVVPLLQKIGASEAIISKFTDSQLGNIAIAYLLYELAKPIRYFVTLAGTRQTIVYLRRKGYVEPVAKEDRIRELYKESREQFKEKRDEFKDKLKDDKYTLIYKERKEQLKEKREEWKEKFSQSKKES